jgi:hypothetical protein
MNELDLRVRLDEHLVAIGDLLLAYYDPCQRVGAVCKAGDANLCCSHTPYGPGQCRFHTEHGCALPNASCRLWLCKTAIAGADPRLVQALQLLEQVGYLFDVVRRPMIGQPYRGADQQP